jgi:hypothetical protein
LINEFDYKTLEDANPWAAPLFFFPSNLVVYIIFYFMFLGIVVGIYNNIRSKKQLESVAVARLFINDYKYKLH